MRRKFVLFLPVALVFILNLATFLAIDSTERIALLNSGFELARVNPGTYSPIIQVFWLGNVALLGGQLALMLLKVNQIIGKERARIKNEPGHLPFLKIGWFLTIFGGVTIFLIAASVLNIILPKGNIVLISIFSLFFLLSGAMTGYFGMRQDTLLHQVMKIDKGVLDTQQYIKETETVETQMADPSVEEYSEENQKIINRIRRYMTMDKPYLDEDLSLAELAIKLGMNKRELTYIINDVMHRNFYGMVNEYRVMEAKELLRRPEYKNYTIETIAYEVGFKSKSSFNACFKKITGNTPSQFRVGI